MEFEISHKIGESVWLILRAKKILNRCPLCKGKGFVISSLLSPKVTCIACKGTGGEHTTSTFVRGPFVVEGVMILMRKNDDHVDIHTEYEIVTDEEKYYKDFEESTVYRTYYKTEQEALAKCAELAGDNTPFR